MKGVLSNEVLCEREAPLDSRSARLLSLISYVRGQQWASGRVIVAV